MSEELEMGLVACFVKPDGMSWGGGEAVAAHDFADGGGVGWGAGRGGLEDGGDLAEEVGAEEAGRDDGEGFCRGGVEVFEAVDDSARDED